MEAEKPVLALDMDDVVKHFAYPCAVFYNGNFQPPIDPYAMSRYFHPEDMGLEYDEAVSRVVRFHSTGESRLAPPIKDSQEDIEHLASDMSLHIVTARQHEFKGMTEEWLDEHYPGVFDEVHLANHHSKEGVQRTKLEICRSIGAVGLVDDSGEHVTKVADGGLLGFLFRHRGSYSWNSSVASHPNVVEVHRLSDVHDFCKSVGVI